MKIIILGTTLPAREGMAAFNECLAQQLIKEGHEVEIYPFTLQHPELLFLEKTQYRDEPAPENLKIIQKINSVNSLNWIKAENEPKYYVYNTAIAQTITDFYIHNYETSFIGNCKIEKEKYDWTQMTETILTLWQ